MARKRFITSASVLYGVCVAQVNGSIFTKVDTSVQQKSVIVPVTRPSYYTRCWGKLIPITETQAAILRPTGNVIIR